MATRFYLTTLTAPYTPATLRGAWDQTAGAVTRALSTSKNGGGASASVAQTETNAAANYDCLLYRGVTGPLAALTIGGTVDVVLGVSESNVANDEVYHLHIYVTQGDSDTPRGTILSDYIDATEWPTTATGRALAAAQALTGLAISDGDRIVVEIGSRSTAASATSATSTLYYGTQIGTAEMPDLAAASTAVTVEAGSIVFSDDFTFSANTVGRLSHVHAEVMEDGDGAAATGRLSQVHAEVMEDGAGFPALAWLTHVHAEVMSDNRGSAPTAGGTPPTPVEPTVSDIPSGVTRLFAVLTWGAGSPYSQMKIAETALFFDPPTWYGGYGYPWLLSVSPIKRELSDAVRGVECTVTVADPDRVFRALATTETLSGATMELFLCDDEVRYALGEPHRRFAGRVHDHRALPGFRYEFTLRDILSEVMADLADSPRMPPGRLTATLFPGMTKDYENRAIPIALGEISDASSTTPQGVVPPLIVAPSINLLDAFGGVDVDVVAAIVSHGALPPNGLWQGYYNSIDNPYVRIPIPASAWGTLIAAPGMPGWSYLGLATDYIDYPADPTLTHRYTPVFFLASDPNVQAVLDGRIQVAFNLYGLTDEADGSGLYYADAPDIYEFLIRNWLYPPHWRYGAYNGTPTFLRGYTIVNHDSVVLSRNRLRAFTGSPGAYPVGFLLGRGGQQATLRHVLTELCAGVLMEQGIDRHGRILLDVEDVDAAATVTLSDIHDIEDGEFEVRIDRSAYRNNAEFLYGYRYLPAVAPLPTPPEGETLPAQAVGPHTDWSETGRYTHTAAVAANQGTLTPPMQLENYVVRDPTVAADWVARSVARAVGPSPSYDGPRQFRLTTSWQALGVELGDVIAIDHLEGLGASGYVGQRARVLAITDDLQNARITLEGRILYSS